MTGGGVDYESGPYRVTILAGQLSVQFDIAIKDDNILEGNENFDLTINATSLPDCVVVTGPNQATITILDNDGKYHNKTYNYRLIISIKQKY